MDIMHRIERVPLLEDRDRKEWAQGWQNLTMTHWQHVIFGDESRFQLYSIGGKFRIRHLHGERFQQRCQAYGVPAGGASVHVWGAFHSGAKSPHVLLDRYFTGELYRSILRNTLGPFARQHFGDNYRYQKYRHTSSCSRSHWFPSAGQRHLDRAALFGTNWAMLSQVWTTRLWILGSSAKPCYINGQKSPQNACNAL